MGVSDAIIKAVSWTFVHSLWQGIILAISAGLIILATRKSAAALRYNLLSVLFVFFLAAAGLTFYYEFSYNAIDTAMRIHLPIINEQSRLGYTGTESFFSLAIDFLNSNARLIVMIWLFAFAFKLFGILHAFGNIYRIRNYKTFLPSEYWTNRLAELALQLQIRKPIVLLESALVKMPSVTGFFKPIITVPIGMLANLPQDQVEAILLHELAHIRRKDYIVNLLQHLAEMVFFFNPGVLWLSSLIKDERENCCDDIALKFVGNKTHFVHALISFETFNTQKLALAFAGKKNHLLQRVKRIIYNDNKSLNTIEKTFLSLSLLAVAIIMIAFAGQQKTDKLNNEAPKSQPANVLQSTVKENTKPVCDATNNIDSFEKIDEENQQAMPYNLPAGFILPVQPPSKTTNKTIYTVLNKDEIAAPVCTPEPVCVVEPVEPAASFNVPDKNSVITRTVNSKTKTSHSFEKEVTVIDTQNPKNNKHISFRTGVSGQNLPDDMDVDNLTSSIIADLMHKNIIKNTAQLSYKLSDSSLIVNGVKQCQTVHAALKDKYVKTKNYTICYNYDFSGDLYANN